MKEIMEFTDSLCKNLQCQSRDILNATHFVTSTKEFIQKFRDDGWDDFLTTMKSFCELHSIDIPNMNARYVGRRARARHLQDDFTIEHHYRVDLFYAARDSQLHELNCRFTEDAVELLIRSSAFESKEAYESFRLNDILLLVNKFYP